MIIQFTRLIIINKKLPDNLSPDDIKAQTVGRVALFCANTRPEMILTGKTLSQTVGVDVIESEYFDAMHITGYSYPGFEIIKKAEADTAIVIGNSFFLVSFLGSLEKIKGVNIANSVIMNKQIYSSTVTLIDWTEDVKIERL
ncbi:MAG: hypothetical protein V4665_02940 [Patescibacteria group bacterium]